jgi:amidophosphoribosyltransferase
MDGVSVYKARLAMGEALANTVSRKLGHNIDIDVVIPVRFSGTLFFHLG